MEIKAIDQSTVHRICSGQVVLTLAVAVKELVENAVDAGATSVEVRLQEYGSKLIEVIDNGVGVEEKNFEGLTLKHHTSKIDNFEDLECGVSTFGFRGEALSSLCALSKLCVSTRHNESLAATKIEYNNHGKIVSRTLGARQVGTTVTLQDLFITLPVRHKEFLRNLKKEFHKMVVLLNAYCIISTGVRITCSNTTSHGKRSVVVSTNGSSDMIENIAAVFGSKQLTSLKPFTLLPPTTEHKEEFNVRHETDEQPFTISGHLSSSAHGSGRGSVDRQYYFINGRPCEIEKLSRLINEVYHCYNKHQYPCVFLNIAVDKGAVDVNVTPDKRKIFLDYEPILLATVKTSLVDLWEPEASTYMTQNVPLSQDVTAGQTESGNSLKRSFAELYTQVKENREAVSKKKVTLDSFMHAVPREEPRENSPTESQHTPASSTSSDFSVTCSTSVETFHLSNTSDQANDRLIAEMFKPPASVVKSKSLTLHSIKRLPRCETLATEDNICSQTHTENLNIANVQTLSVPTGLESDQEPSSHVDGERLLVHPETVEVENPQTSIDVKPQCGTVHVTYSDTSISKTKICVGVQFSLASLKKKLSLDNSSSATEMVDCPRFRAKITPSQNTNAEDELKRSIDKTDFNKMEVLGQFNHGFIICMLRSDLFIIDQHASDEKYNFEMLQRHTVIKRQTLLVPKPLSLSSANELLLMDNVEAFHKNGFEFAIKEDAEPTLRVSLKTQPVSKNWTFGKDDIDEILYILREAPERFVRPSRVRAMFASRACRKSVMIGKPLGRQEMSRLVRNMGEIEQPWNCPHGRPTMRHLVNLDLIQL